MDKDKERVVPVMTKHERQEMLNLQEQGELPENIDRSTDLYFRFLLGTPARGRLLRDMLNALFGALGYPLLQTVTLTDTEREPEAVGAKYTRLDLTALDDLGRTLHIEMQRENYTHFQKRCLFYLCRNYTRSLKRGEGYASLSPIVSISLLGFDLFEGARGLWDFALMNPGTGRRLMEADDLLLFYVELNKAARPLRELRAKLKASPNHVLSPEERAQVWGGYINNESDGLALLRESLSGDTVFSEVSEVEQEYWSSPENRYYQLREMVTQLDFKAIREDRLAEATRIAREKAWAEGRLKGETEGWAKGKAEGEAKGWAKGKAEGVAEGEAKGKAEGELLGRQETARAMLREGMSPESVARFTRLSLDEVEALKKS